MKKLTFYFALVVSLLAMPAMAQATTITDWELNISPSITYSGIDFLTVGGLSQINQDYGTDGVLSVGDTFSATSSLFMLTMVDINQQNTPLASSITLSSSNLAGVVTSVGADGSFTYDYTSGDVDLMYGTTVLATLTLDAGRGESTDSDISNLGQFLDGESDFNVNFDSDPLASGLIDFDLSAYPELGTSFLSSFELNLTNQLFTGSAAYVTATANGYIATVYSSGSLALVATPEPSTFLILGLGLLGLVGFRKKFTA